MPQNGASMVDRLPGLPAHATLLERMASMNQLNPLNLWSHLGAAFRLVRPRHDPGPPRQPRPRTARGRLAVSLSTALMVGLIGTGSAMAAGSADEIHFTFTGSTSVAFDWRGTATDIRYGPTVTYGSTATSHTPTPLP